MNKRGFYALVNLYNDVVIGIHYFNGETFTECLALESVGYTEGWFKYNPRFKDPGEYNANRGYFYKMEYLGE